MSEVRYERNSRGIEAILMSGDMARAMHGYAGTGVTLFESIAPHRSGHYGGSADIVDTVDTIPSPRRVAQLVAGAEYSASVEWGNHRGQKGQHVLAAVADTLESLR